MPRPGGSAGGTARRPGRPAVPAPAAAPCASASSPTRACPSWAATRPPDGHGGAGRWPARSVATRSRTASTTSPARPGGSTRSPRRGHDVEELRPGDPRRVGPYAVVARQGSGGRGTVFLGRSAGGRSVAVKVVHAALAGDADFRKRFAQEITAARAVSGAFTAPVNDADPDAPAPRLVTAYLPGASLHRVVETSGPLPPGSVATLGAGLAEALVAIHRAGVVHRDLKPSNVLLTPDGPRVIDFGVARAAEVSGVTRTGATLGSHGYLLLV